MKEVCGRADADFTNGRKHNRRGSREQIRKQYLPIVCAQVLSGRDEPLEKWRPWFAESHDLRIFVGGRAENRLHCNYYVTIK
jgi:hypothetical protein